MRGVTESRILRERERERESNWISVSRETERKR